MYFHPKDKQFDLAEMVKLLKMRKMNNHRTVLLLGARTGRLFRSEHFYGSLHQFSKRDFFKLSRTEQFSECYSILTENQFSEMEIHQILSMSLQDPTVTAADACLANLVKHGHFDDIISTNIDEALEVAFNQAELQEWRDFDVFIPRPGVLHYERSHPYRVIKAFGDLSSRVYVISRRLSHLDSNQDLKHFLQRILARDILIVGIDPIWDEDIIRAIPEKAGTIWFVNEDNPNEHPLLSSILRERQSRWVVGAYDYFMRTIHGDLCGEAPIALHPTHNILKQLTKMLVQLQTIQDENKNIQDENKIIQNENKIILSEIKKLQSEIDNDSDRQG